MVTIMVALTSILLLLIHLQQFPAVQQFLQGKFVDFPVLGHWRNFRISTQFKMDMGFLNKSSDLLGGSYNMSIYGFPIFYEYDVSAHFFTVNFIIANGTIAVNKQYPYP